MNAVTSQQTPKMLIKGLGKEYGSVTALEPSNLTVNTGEFVTLLGPSGSGKTTLLQMISGLVDPTHGELWVDGKNYTHTAVNKRDMGLVFQHYALFPHMTVSENIAFPLKMRGTSSTEVSARVAETLAKVQLEKFASRFPRELSGGQQQRVAVARALVLEPQVLLLDEPLSNLDARLRRRVRTEIRELQQRLGFTAVYVTHDQDEALAVSDTIIVMKDGDIAQQGSPRDLYESPASAFIADFMGEANVVPCEVVSAENGEAVIRIGKLSHRLASSHARLGPAQLAVRPNAVSLQAQSGGDFPGRVAHSAYLGDHIEYEIETEHGKLFIVDPVVEEALPPQTDVAIHFKPRGLAIINN